MSTQCPPRSSDAEGNEAQSSSSSTALGALRVVIGLGFVGRVTSLQLASLECLIACRETANFKLKLALKTPRKVWHAKLGGTRGGSSKVPRRSERLTLPRVTRILYDRPSFDLGQGWQLPSELKQLVLGVEFGGDIDGVTWPSALESVVFWRRYGHYFRGGSHRTFCARVPIFTCGPFQHPEEATDPAHRLLL